LAKPEETEPLCYMLDLFLDHARRAANAIVPYLRHKYSLHGQVHWSIARWNEGDWEKVPDCDVRELARKYWEGYGKKVKDYRDLSQHRTLVAYDDCGLVTRAGVTEFYIALPNNPDVFRDGKPKAMERLSYDPPIHAILYMEELLHETIRFVNRFSVRLLDPSKPRNVALLGPNIRGSIGPSRQGIRVLSVRTIDAELRKLLAELAEEESRGA